VNPGIKDALGLAIIVLLWLVILNMMFGVVCDPTDTITGLGRTRDAPAGYAMRVSGGE
jgi:hypothetical protein